ncbi:MAG: TIGR04283 family arsenosugar biosynthesis glycosyltransferase [Pseudomonadota bacterium]
MISVIIPTLNVERSLGPCLGALSPAILDPLLSEVIFADGGSTDATEEIAEATGASFVTASRGRGTQLRAAAETARADWMLFLHADTVMTDEWVDAVRAHMRRGPEMAGWFRLRFDAAGVAPALVSRWANMRAMLGLPYGDQGLLIHRSLYREVGGFPDIPLMEDVAIARAIGRRRLAMMSAEARTSADRYRKNGWITQGARNLATLTRYSLGARPETLARSYNR